MTKRALHILLSLLLLLTLTACKSTEAPEPAPSTEAAATLPQPEPTETTEATEAPETPAPWNLILANPWNPIPQDFSVELTVLEDGHSVDSRIYADLQEMLDQMSARGLRPVICSSYRTDEKQQELYRNKVQSYLNQGYSLADADLEAGKWVAVPGTSEHQTGLTLDIIDYSYPYLNENQENTRVQKWLMAHSWEYGFILRYPSDKTDLTGIYYEPWHYRYVGKKAAVEIHSQNLCLEEYLNQ